MGTNVTRVYYSGILREGSVLLCTYIKYNITFSTAALFWGQTTLIPSMLCPKRDCGPRRAALGNLRAFLFDDRYVCMCRSHVCSLMHCQNPDMRGDLNPAPSTPTPFSMPKGGQVRRSWMHRRVTARRHLPPATTEPRALAETASSSSDEMRTKPELARECRMLCRRRL